MPWQQQSAADMEAIRGAKATLRQAVLQRRRIRPDDQRDEDDHGRFDQLRRFLAGSDLGTAACYLSAAPEPGTLRLIAWLASQNVRVLLPVITEPAEEDQIFGAPDWAPYGGPDMLRTGRLSLIEPATEPVGAEALGAAELIITPGLAGNAHGLRLGRGGGWYDRALEHADPAAAVVMLLNDDEVVEVIPTHPWDRRVDAIATATQMINCRS
jgi:5-formyltetrahydrofolate cyclo-ligase